MVDYTLEKGNPDIVAGNALFYVSQNGLYFFRYLRLNPDEMKRKCYEYFVNEKAELELLKNYSEDVLDLGSASTVEEVKNLLADADSEYMQKFLHCYNRVALYSRIPPEERYGFLEMLVENYLRHQRGGDYDMARQLHADIMIFSQFIPRNEDGELLYGVNGHKNFSPSQS